MTLFNIGIPQLIWLASAFGQIAYVVAHHGEPRTGTHNAFATVIAVVISFGVLYWGGFFDVVPNL